MSSNSMEKEEQANPQKEAQLLSDDDTFKQELPKNEDQLIDSTEKEQDVQVENSFLKRKSMLNKKDTPKSKDPQTPKETDAEPTDLKSSFKNSKFEKKKSLMKSGGLRKVKAKVDNREEKKEEQKAEQNQPSEDDLFKTKTIEEEDIKGEESDVIKEDKEPKEEMTFKKMEEMGKLYRPSGKKTKENKEKKDNPNPIDEQPIGGGGKGYDLDNLDQIEDTYVPSDKGKKIEKPKPVVNPNPVDEQPIGGGGKGYDLDNLDQIEDTYVPSSKRKKPVKPKPKPVDNNPVDELPVGGGKGGYDLDNLDQIEDTYVPSSKRKKPTKQKPPVANNNPVDEMPIGGGGKGYDLDNLDQIEDTYVPSSKGKKPAKPKPKPVVNPNPVDDQPIGGGGKGYDLDNLDQIEDTYVPSSKRKKPTKPKPKPVNPNPVEDQPIGGGGGGYNLDNIDQMEDTYVPSGKGKKKPVKPKPTTNPNPVDEQPIGGGGGGGYNLDNLDQIEDTYVPSSKRKKPTKPKAKPANPNPVDEQPIGGGKQPNPVSEMKIGGGGGGGGYNLDKMADAFPPGGQPGAQNDADEDEDLEMRLKSPKFAVRITAYEELMKWEDAEMTCDKFLKNLHLTIKERHTKVLDKLISVIESLIEGNKGDWSLLDFGKFMLNFCEHAMSNAKKEAKTHVNSFVVKLFNFYGNKDQFIENLIKCLGTIKMKVQVNTLNLILELLKAEKIEELQFMKPFMPALEKLLSSRTAAVKKTIKAVFKEAYLWMGESLKVFIANFKKAYQDDLNKVFAAIEQTEMKTLTQKAGGKKMKKIDAYEIADEVELPKEFTDDLWAEDIMQMKKWKDKKQALDKLLTELGSIAKLKPKTNTHHFVSLAKRLLSENNIMNQVTMLKILGKLAGALRKSFISAEKNLFGTLVGKLKEKNKMLTEEICNTLLAFYISLPFEDTMEDFKENLKDKNKDKKLNILKVILAVIEKLEKIKNESIAAKIVKMVIKLLEEGNPGVRDLTSQVIARLKDLFPEKISPLLTDLNVQKLKNINKYSNTQDLMKEEAKEEEEEGKKKPGKKGRADKRNPKGMTKDKLQMIKDISEHLFSNKTVKISDTKNFSKYLESNLKNLSELTKDFKEVTTNQQKEIFKLIEEIGNKVEKAAFLDDSRKTFALFYIEQTLSKYSEDVIKSIKTYTNSPNKLLTIKHFINDIFDVVSRRNIKVSRDLLTLIVKLMESELSQSSSLSSIPHKSFVEFLKNSFSTGTIHSSVKQIIISLMRTLSKKFGGRVINDYPANILKDFEAYNNEIQKSFKKTMEKLNDKNVERKKNALNELSNITDNSKIQLFWSMPEFVSYLKRSLITESNMQTYDMLINTVKNYLDLNKKSSVDFSLKTYLAVFHIIITQYYDRVDNNQSYNPEKFAIIEDIFSKTINEIGPTKILNEMLKETNAFTYKEQICNFFMQFGEEIETDVKFMEYIVSLINSKYYNNEIKQLVDNVLLILKNTTNEDLIFKGNENKIVRDIWQKNEEDVLFDENFVKGNKIFEDISLFNSVRVFMQNILGLEESTFFAKNIDSFVITEFDEQTKIKLAFFYLKSIENTPSICETIFCQIKRVNLTTIDNTTLLLIIKILINLLKNNLYAMHDNFYQEVKEFFVSIIQDIHVTVDELFTILDLNGLEIGFITKVLNNVEGGGGGDVDPSQMQSMYEGEGEDMESQYQTAKKGGVYNQRDNSVLNDTFTHNQGDISGMGNDRRPGGTVSRRLSKPTPQMDEEYYSTYNKDVSINIQSPKSYASKNSSRKNLYVNQLGNNNNQTNNASLTNEVALENKMMLEQQFKNMLTYDLVQFKNASDYFLALCKSKKPDSTNFLISNADNTINVFTEVFVAIFTEGINFDLERSDYELIFVPLQTICEVSGFMEVVNQNHLNVFVEQVLLRLVVSNEEKTQMDKAKEDQDKIDLASFIVKSFNSIMLRIIDNSEVNALLTALFVLIINTKDNQGDPMSQAVYNLAFKCIVRITRSLKNIIQKVDPRIVLNLIFNYIDNFGVRDSSSIGSKSIKTLLNELVTRSNPEFIWNCYYDVFGNLQEQNISKWIKIIQSKMNNENREDRSSESEQALLHIIETINSQNKVHQLPFYAEKIKEILIENPSIDFSNFAGYFNNRAFYNVIEKNMMEDQGEEEHDQSMSQQSMNRNSRNMDDYLNNSYVNDSNDYYKKIDRMKNKFINN